MNSKSVSREALMVNHWIQGGVALYNILGDYAIGIALVKCYCDGHEGQTADSVAAILGGIISVDTARRRLTKMVETGVARCVNHGRFRVYKINAEFAEEALAFMRAKEF